MSPASISLMCGWSERDGISTPTKETDQAISPLRRRMIEVNLLRIDGHL
jgi:hypothetical protein